MFSHKSILRLGTINSDILTLEKDGYELANFEFSFQQGIDFKGDTSTLTYGGTMHMTLFTIPSKEIIEWALDSRKYHTGEIVVMDSDGVPQEKIQFENAACTSMAVDYTRQGNTYSLTKLTVHSDILKFGDGLDFDNFWKKQ